MPSRSSLPDLSGRVCLITGATRGIGRATVDGLAALDARLVLLCRRQEDGERIADELARSHRAAHPGRPFPGPGQAPVPGNLQ